MLSGNSTTPGGAASFTVKSTSPAGASGTSTNTVDLKFWPLGPLILTLDPAHDELHISALGDYVLCGPKDERCPY